MNKLKSFPLLFLISTCISCKKSETIDLNHNYEKGYKFLMEIKTVIKGESFVLSNVLTRMRITADSVINNGKSYILKVDVISIIDTTIALFDGKKVIYNSDRAEMELTEKEYEKHLEVRRILGESLYIQISNKGIVEKPFAFAGGDYPPSYMADFNNLLLRYPANRHKIHRPWSYFSESRLNFQNRYLCKVTDIKDDNVFIKVKGILGGVTKDNTAIKKYLVEKHTGRIIYGESLTHMSMGLTMYDTLRTWIINNDGADPTSLDKSAYNEALQKNTIVALKQYLRDFPNGAFSNQAISLIVDKAAEADQYRRQKSVEKQEIIDRYNKRIKNAQKKGKLIPVYKKIAGHEFIFIKGDMFFFGDTNTVISEQPKFTVSLSDYYISRYETTFEQYDAFCDATGKPRPYDNGRGRGERPVINVSWKDSKEYCDWLSEKYSKKFDLPTEAQWEYAARGGMFSKGFKYSGSNEAEDVSVGYNDPHGQSALVGSKAPNELGIYDMTGNAFEWCSDWYKEIQYEDEFLYDPAGPLRGNYRSLRGGSFRMPDTKLTERFFNKEDAKFEDAGFRIILKAEK